MPEGVERAGRARAGALGSFPTPFAVPGVPGEVVYGAGSVSAGGVAGRLA